MPVEWVKAVERTQTGHLPDAVDPAPLESGIGVYFTKMTWGGVPMAILEDRKWKSGPGAVLPKGAKNAQLAAEAVDPPGASLLGGRQEKFLGEWAAATREEPLRLVFSQTIFCKGHTHTGPTLNRNHFDWDSNGWPRSGRQRALQPLKGNRTLMLHGDQHLGLLVRHGIEEWNDGPWAFMVPGTANGWPRAWWPEDGRIAGDFTDPFGNKFSVLAAANPEKGSNTLKPLTTDPPEPWRNARVPATAWSSSLRIGNPRCSKCGAINSMRKIRNPATSSKDFHKRSASVNEASHFPPNWITNSQWDGCEIFRQRGSSRGMYS
jgi:alkaline phosphatase D